MSDEQKQENTQETSENNNKNNPKKSWLKQNIIPVAVLLSIGLLCVVGIFLGQKEHQVLVTVTHKGTVIMELNLSENENELFTEVGTPEGEYNVIEVTSGRIRVREATCPDQICVLQGYSSGDGRPIVCLPHELVITFEGGEAGFDAVTG